MNARAWLRASGALAAGPAVVLLTLAWGFDPARHEAAQPLIHRAGGYVGPTACEACHPDQHASWARTFHRTMTQRPTRESVRGAFDGREVRYAGETARPFVASDGRFAMDLPTPDGGRRTAFVALTVGSRRYQQYFERVERSEGFAFVRLPILWHIGSERWLHLDTVFLSPDLLDPATYEWMLPDWDRHADTWNGNCIFCHNTGPMPGERLPADPGSAAPIAEREFDTRVAELGIACESCHGPGAEHVAAYANPLARYADHASVSNETHIVNPERLDQERSVAICGQCHGQRLPRDIGEMLTTGPSYRPGERLVDHVEPLELDMPLLPGQPEPGFRPRFWGDGTPRLTAYEYQGVVASPCYAGGEMTCGSCHSMHGGDPRGMLEEPMRGDAACLQCHAEIARDVPAHTRHAAGSSGSQCMECHMPRMVYGILDIHRSHRIENPDPKRDGEAGRPHACTLCHLDRSLEWSARSMTEMFGRPHAPPAERKDGAPVELADGLASLLAGDALQRAAYAVAMGRPASDGEARPGPVDPRDKAWMRAALALTVGDAYPSVRWLARRSLLALEREHPIGMSRRLADWDHMDGSVANRGSMVEALRDELRRLGPARLSPAEARFLMRPDMTEEMAMRQLCDLQSAHVISIGE